MAGQYAPKTFIRQVRGALLNRCLRRHGIDLDVNIEIIKPAEVETIFQKLLSLPQSQLQLVEKDFATITELASPAGVEALLEQARIRGVDLATPFSHARNNYERAAWAFLEHRNLFELTTCFHEMDRIGAGRWKRRWVGRHLPLATTPEAIALLQTMMRRRFADQGRGRWCHIDYYQRQEPLRHCFFAYPEDHARTELGYDKKGMLNSRTRRSAFEVLFVYRPEEGILEVMAPGGAEQVEAMAGYFSAAILNLPELPARILPKAFDLDSLKLPEVRFPTEPQDQIERVQLREVILKLPTNNGWRRRIQFTADLKHYDPASIHQMIVQTVRLENVPLEDVIVHHARFCLFFTQPDDKPVKRLSFSITTPDLCTLKDGYYENLARKYLRLWGFVADVPAEKVPV